MKNIDDVVSLLEAEKRGEAKYISKFIAASAAGLFDATLNYLWDRLQIPKIWKELIYK